MLLPPAKGRTGDILLWCGTSKGYGVGSLVAKSGGGPNEKQSESLCPYFLHFAQNNKQKS